MSKSVQISYAPQDSKHLDAAGASGGRRGRRKCGDGTLRVGEREGDANMYVTVNGRLGSVT